MTKARTQLSPRQLYRRIKQAGLKSEKVRLRVSRASVSRSVHSLNRRKKMLPQMNSAGKTISTNPATKMIDIMSGHVQKRGVRCGKPRCRCNRGVKHTSYYHVWYQNGRRFQKYIRQADVEDYIHACMSNRLFQSNLREGRAEYKKLLASARELWLLASARELWRVAR